MKIYFIIPVYNTGRYLERCINSVLKQTYKDTRIILVDDGSSDNSPKICDDFADKYDNISVIHKKNGGLSDARNCGLDWIEKEADKDDFVTFLDSDDFVRENYSERLIQICTQNNCEAAQCEYEKSDGDKFTETDTKAEIFFKNAEEMLLDQRMKSLSCTKIYKMSCFDGVRFPIGVWNEDEFTTYKALYKCKKIAVTSEKLYYYYQHSSSIMTEIAKKMKNNPHIFDWLDAYKERIAFFEKENKPQQVLRTHEKICTDIILRYCEQMYLKKDDRDEALTGGEYIRLYKESFPIMIKRKHISLKRRLMYIAFYICPMSAILPGKIFKLRK